MPSNQRSLSDTPAVVFFHFLFSFFFKFAKPKATLFFPDLFNFFIFDLVRITLE
jgi:hypothetical protein